MTAKKQKMTPLQKKLFALRDDEYAAFQAKLAPGMEPERIIGVRVPVLRKFAKEYAKDAESNEFLQQLPHTYYEEDMLHALLLEGIKDYDEALQQVNAFLPYVDNWAVCDTLKPKVFAKNKKKLLPQIRTWAKSDETYTIRFGLEMLMNLYLDEDFDPDYLKIPAAVRKDAYYVKMMIAWYFATALAKQWDAAIPYLEGEKLGTWVHNKTIQKAIESYRITDEQKAYLRTLKRNSRS